MFNSNHFPTVAQALVLRQVIFCLLLLSGLAANASQCHAAAPTLADYLHACGIGEDVWAKFSDDRQLAGEEMDVVGRLAVRLRDCPADRLRRLMWEVPVGEGGRAIKTSLPLPAEARARRGQPVRLQGALDSVEPMEGRAGEPLWRCTLTLPQPPYHALVYAADVPERLRVGGTGQHVAAEGVFMKYVPGTTAEPMAVIVAARLQWRPDMPLARCGMDFGLLDGIQDNSALTAADSEAFYGLLRLARDAGSARLDQDADQLDASGQGLSSLFHNPAAQRGRLVRLSGMARRVVRVPVNDPTVISRLGTDHYFEIDVVAERAEGNPLVFGTLELPEGMPLGQPPSYDQPVEVTGFFLKNWQYSTSLSQEEKESNPGAAQALQTAPLLIGPAPHWKPVGREKRTSSDVAFAGLLLLAIIGTGLLLWHLRQSDQEFSRRSIARE
jgi:hypothetical protein